MASPAATAWLALRSLLWVLLLPGFFAGFLPWRYFGLGSVVLDFANPRHWAGVLGLTAGVILWVPASGSSPGPAGAPSRRWIRPACWWCADCTATSAIPCT